MLMYYAFGKKNTFESVTLAILLNNYSIFIVPREVTTICQNNGAEEYGKAISEKV